MGRAVTGIQHRGVVHHEAEQAVELSFRDHTTAPMLMQRLQVCDEILRDARLPVLTAIWEATEHTSHDPRTPAMAIRWLTAHRETLRNSILVTTKTSVARLASITQVMVPGLRVEVVSTLDEALTLAASFAHLGAAPQRRGPRRQAG